MLVKRLCLKNFIICGILGSFLFVPPTHLSTLCTPTPPPPPVTKHVPLHIKNHFLWHVRLAHVRQIWQVIRPSGVQVICNRPTKLWWGGGHKRKRSVFCSQEAKFRNNVIETLDKDLFSNLAFLHKLDLSLNQISTIPEPFIKAIEGSLTKFQFYYAGEKWNWLDGNPLNCDCGIIPLFLYLKRVPDAAVG